MMSLRQGNAFDDLFWKPWNDFYRFGRSVEGRQAEASGAKLPLNIWQNSDGALVSVEAPGLDLESLDIEISGATLTLSGDRAPSEVSDESVQHRRERIFGHFTRSVELPFAVDVDQVKANYENGILEVMLPRQEADKPKKIKVAVN